MAAIRSSGTAPERKVAELLKEVFPRRKVIERPDLPGRPDFYLPGFRIAVMVDGCFWHGCPRHGRVPDDNRTYWEPKLARNRMRDKTADRELRRLGIRPLRIW